MKRIGMILSFALIMIMAAGVVFAGPGGDRTGGAAATGVLPRNETLYLSGTGLWVPVAHWNPYGSAATTFGISSNDSLATQLIYETLFIFNPLDGRIHPQLADSFTWNGNVCTVVLDRNVHWNDGHRFSSADVVNSFTLHRDYQTPYSGHWAFIESVTAVDDYTVQIRANPNNFNPRMIEHTLAVLYMSPKHIWDGIVAQIGTDRMALVQYTNPNPVASGPYRPFSEIGDQTRAILIRDDNYWGQRSPKYGRLAAPRYIVHNIYIDNAAGNAALAAGEVDISNQFTPSIWTFPPAVETYIPGPPYYIPGAVNVIIFNTQRPGLDDAVVRRAIAMATDNDTIIQNALSGYAPQVHQSLMLPIPPELALLDDAALRPHQWSTNLDTAVAEANRLLDQAGWVRGADGIRARGGVRLSFQIQCPSGWSDWNASLEIVAQSARSIGIDLRTHFTTTAVVATDRENGTFDILMHRYAFTGPANPWLRAYQTMGSADLPPVGVPNTVQNFGRWQNAEANDILARIVHETNEATLRQLWTRLNIIYLQEMPVAGIGYTGMRYHTTNNTVWTGFPRINDGSNIPPLINIGAYGIKGLYNLRLR